MNRIKSTEKTESFVTCRLFAFILRQVGQIERDAWHSCYRSQTIILVLLGMPLLSATGFRALVLTQPMLYVLVVSA